jgi:hypothetical protein
MGEYNPAEQERAYRHTGQPDPQDSFGQFMHLGLLDEWFQPGL